jgi:hypothetical protein
LLHSLCVSGEVLLQVLVQLLELPSSITTARQLSITLEPYSIRVEHKTTGQVFLQGELARGIVPEDSNWTFSPPPDSKSHTSSRASNRSSSGNSSDGAVTAGAVACAVTCNVAAPEGYGEGRLLLQLTKLNLELYER